MAAANPVTLPLAEYSARHVRFEVAGKVATLTLDRPDKKNPLTFDTQGASCAPLSDGGYSVTVEMSYRTMARAAVLLLARRPVPSGPVEAFGARDSRFSAHFLERDRMAAALLLQSGDQARRVRHDADRAAASPPRSGEHQRARIRR
jgi:hypothetical protein